jgi:hypothetical protein
VGLRCLLSEACGSPLAPFERADAKLPDLERQFVPQRGQK